MFSRFKSIFSKNKTDTDASASASSKVVSEPNTVENVNTSDGNCSAGPPKLEGLNFIKSLVESEQMLDKPQAMKDKARGESSNTSTTAPSTSFTQEVQELLTANLSSNDNEPQEIKKIIENGNVQQVSKDSNVSIIDPNAATQAMGSSHEPDTSDTDSVHSLLHKMKTEVVTLDYETKVASPISFVDNKEATNQSSDQTDSAQIPQESKTSNVISWIEENNAIFTPPTPYPLASTESAINLNNSSSVVVEDLPTEITAPSPSMESSISGSSSNTSTSTTVDSISTRLAADPTKVVINPTGSNGMACTAITGKLTDIAEVAESLDTVIRDIQENSQRVEVESNPSPRDKKLGTLRSTSSEDWHSRSTEDDSFVTASEGRTSSYMSCNKSSFDYSEGDDSTLAFDMPDVNSPFNMSFDESEHSFISAQQDGNKTPTKLSENDDVTLDELRAPSSLADIEDLHSESATPTPAETEELYVDSIPVESETELEVATIANASSMQVLTECPKMPMSLTPEVSPCSNKRHTAQDEASTSNAQTNATNPNGSDQAKPSVAWRRSKYYENLTKQTIKGFL